MSMKRAFLSLDVLASCLTANLDWPLFRLRARGSPSFLSSHLPLFEGDGAPTKRWPGSPGRRLARFPGPGRETSRPAPCGAPTRHLGLTPQSAIGPDQELFVPGGVCPEAARGSGLRKRLPAGCRSRSPLSRRLMKTPSTMDRDGFVDRPRTFHCQGKFH
jgi:hypothetical protein